MAARFYVNCSLAPGPIVLEGPEVRHLATVCRSRPGDLVCLFNGDGREYPAVLTAVHRRTVGLEITGVESPARELNFRLEVAVPLPKGDRATLLVEKLTELGVTTFVPLRTQRSIVHPRDAKLDRLQRHVVEASKQCGRNVLMQVEPLADWTAYCRRESKWSLRLLAHPFPTTGENEPVDPRLRDAAGDIQLAVGPEGGFTEEEVELAAGQGWRHVDLGPRILRVETAALVLAALASQRASGRGPKEPFRGGTP